MDRSNLYAHEVDANHNAIDQLRMILNDHEKRIQKMEGKK